MRPNFLKAMLLELSQLDLADPAVCQPFCDKHKYSASNAYKAIKGLSEEELYKTENAPQMREAKELCFICRHTLENIRRPFLKEELYPNWDIFPLIGGPLEARDEKAFFQFFSKIDFQGRGAVGVKELREWIRKESLSVSESLFVDMVLECCPTVRPHFARLEEFVQNAEAFAVLRDADLHQWVFNVFVKLSGGEEENKIYVNKLVSIKKYFTDLVRDDGDDWETKEKKQKKQKAAGDGDVSLNDIFAINLLRKASNGKVDHRAFQELCRQNAMCMFPVKWIQSAFFSLKGVGQCLQGRIVLAERHHDLAQKVKEKQQMQRHINMYAKAINRQTKEATMKIKPPAGQSVSHNNKVQDAESALSGAGENALQSPGNAILQKSVSKADMKIARKQVIRQKRESRKIQYQLDLQKNKVGGFQKSSMIGRQSFFFWREAQSGE